MRIVSTSSQQRKERRRNISPTPTALHTPWGGLLLKLMLQLMLIGGGGGGGGVMLSYITHWNFRSVDAHSEQKSGEK